MEEKELKMYGGIWGGLVPLVVLLVGMIWLSIEAKGNPRAFWACTWIAIAVGMFFACDKAEYCKAAMRGIGDKTGIVIVAAWLFAGVFGTLMKAGGLVNGLLWLGMTTGAQGAVFTLLVFIAAMLFALGTGTSTGTCIALAPVLYPAGYFLGADPTLLGLAILSGAAFGDNLAPVSDTTIVSAYTQGAAMKDVVRSRFPLAMFAAAVAGAVFIVFGGGGEVKVLPEIKATLNPSGLLMLLALAVVVFSALRGSHIIASLVYGNITAAVVGICIGTIKVEQLFNLPKNGSTGLIQDGINGVVAPIIFAILVLAVTQILVESGIMRKILAFAEKSVVASVRQAELFIVGVTILASVPISANAPAELLVGPSLVKPMGEKFNLAPARRANLMDCAVCTIFFTLPWHLCVVAWNGALSSAAKNYGIPAPDIMSALYNPYSWALLAVLVFSAVTGWNRRFADKSDSGEAA
ncbi:MAG: sodium:proton antiporter [Mailhella sp.]|nr:sodium:proton antiporter [Mailhella sp.]